MTRQKIESALKLCAEHEDKCTLCPYVQKGCFRTLMRDSLQYIKQLKVSEKNALRSKGKEARGKR